MRKQKINPDEPSKKLQEIIVLKSHKMSIQHKNEKSKPQHLSENSALSKCFVHFNLPLTNINLNLTTL